MSDSQLSPDHSTARPGPSHLESDPPAPPPTHTPPPLDPPPVPLKKSKKKKASKSSTPSLASLLALHTLNRLQELWVQRVKTGEAEADEDAANLVEAFETADGVAGSLDDARRNGGEQLAKLATTALQGSRADLEKIGSNTLSAVYSRLPNMKSSRLAEEAMKVACTEEAGPGSESCTSSFSMSSNSDRKHL